MGNLRNHDYHSLVIRLAPSLFSDSLRCKPSKLSWGPMDADIPWFSRNILEHHDIRKRASLTGAWWSAVDHTVPGIKHDKTSDKAQILLQKSHAETFLESHLVLNWTATSFRYLSAPARETSEGPILESAGFVSSAKEELWGLENLETDRPTIQDIQDIQDPLQYAPMITMMKIHK